jgi:hypothetical protein
MDLPGAARSHSCAGDAGDVGVLPGSKLLQPHFLVDSARLARWLPRLLLAPEL